MTPTNEITPDSLQHRANRQRDTADCLERLVKQQEDTQQAITESLAPNPDPDN